jgi:hypothetical protein
VVSVRLHKPAHTGDGREHAMNALRTIGQEETPEWIALWLRKGPHAGEHVPG